MTIERDMQVILTVAGVDWRGWKDVEIVRQLDAVAGSFSLGLADKWENGMQSIPLSSGMECEITYGGHPLIRGFIGTFAPSFSATDHAIKVSGRDKSGDLVDCSAVHSPGHWQGLTVDALANILAAPFGVGVGVEGEVGEAFASFKLEQGETAFEALDRACRQRELLATPDGRGGIVLCKVGSGKASTALEQGKNILSASATYTMDDRFSDYIVQGQQPGNDEQWGEWASAVSGAAQDASVKRYRPFIVRAENQVNSASAHARAQWEATVRAARSVNVQVTVQGWLDESELWAINSMVQVTIPYLRIDQELLITEVAFSKSLQSGTLTKLTCRDPKSFLQEPQKQEASSGSSGGADAWVDLQESSANNAETAHANIRGEA